MTGRPLAVVSPRAGARSETFIRRHVEDLLPGGTVAICRGRAPGSCGWSAGVPVLELDGLRPGLIRRGLKALASPEGRSHARQAAAEAFLKRHGVEVMLGEYLDASLEWMDVARAAGIRFFAHAHGHDVSARLGDPSWKAAYVKYTHADGVITVSRFTRARLIDLGLEPSKIHVVPCGVDVPASPAVRPSRPRVRCLAVGRMVGKKAPILLLDAFRRAAEKGVEKSHDLHLDVVGAGVLYPAAQQFITAFGLESSVTLHGSMSHDAVLGLMNDADVFIQHSLTDSTDGDEEGLPVAILEAMAAALPVVSTLHAGIPEAVEDGRTGYLVDEGDSVGMSERLTCLAHDYERRRTMGHAGWRRAVANYSWGDERKRLLEILGLESR